MGQNERGQGKHKKIRVFTRCVGRLLNCPNGTECLCPLAKANSTRN